jgi:hypothetical protein
MTTWTSISNAAVAVGGIPASTTVTALRDNPSAIAEAASGAPVVFAGWHPQDKVTIGDGKTGLIYDHAVTGTVSSVVTPDFVDGYEYRIIAHLMESDAGATVRLNLEAFFETDAAYRRLAYTADEFSSNEFGYDAEILMPRIATKTHLVQGIGYADGNVGLGIDGASYDATLQKVMRARVRITAGNIIAGKVWMFRRREYASLP